MASRKLGGGRVLGSGKGLAPPTETGETLRRVRSSSPHAPSDVSSLSRGSHIAAGLSPPSTPSTLPGADQDLTANISLATPSLRDGGQLVCPICQEEMVTLLQLNRHIDDAHQELPEIQQDEVKTWFDKQVTKAKKFQPLSILNQKLRGIEAFESNASFPTHTLQTAPSHGGPSKPTPEPTVDPDVMITRKHWQRPTGHDMCTDPTCPKTLGPLNGSINCRVCGKLFCEVHTMYQTKLSRSANYDPMRGYWARVCETCYKSRPGYNDHCGVEADLTGGFMEVRKGRIERQNLEIARLEKRLTKLTQLLADPPPELVAVAGVGAGSGGTANLLSPVSALSGHKNLRKTIEQSVIAWEDDSKVARCPFCQQEFGSWTFRRHHCRICGRVVCADPQTGCSREVGLSVATRKRNISANPTEKLREQAEDKVDVDIRMCRDCNSTIFSKRDFDAAAEYKPADQRAYETLRQFEWGIRQLMPLFQRSLQSLQPDAPGSNRPPATRAQIQEAAKIRKRLMDSFTKYNLAAVRLRDLKTESPAQRRLQKSVFTAASTFLHLNMVPLKHVPKMLRSHQPSANASTHRRLLANLNGGSPQMSPLRNGENIGDGTDSGSVAGSEVSTAVSVLETEEREVRENLAVLEEQRFLVQQMVDSAHGSRRFEEVGALSRNVEELDFEINRLRLQVNGVRERWENLYGAT
ncbi:vacuolar segregation protein (Pep7) [Sporothrix schenckii 1099-18]|uniref:Vacuolar segregation protein (Pep7) n=1 Tax=Sporothrix schenckii 1099-18 TaxID=1397361 RepID=A0A0F2M733_SPOSC|nr:vacuolar segregation protein (Pep7) [Sporothrix schenckii 1099-18]KJR84904.1 vacuolar segregation protein (Pep7) [Sporothrix schenckii 1099-18]